MLTWSAPVGAVWADTKMTLATLTLVVVLGGAGGASASVVPGPELKTCFWSDVVDRAQNNILLPDANATYWYTSFYLPAGGKVVLRGQFPHARSFFVFNYHLVTPADGLNDVQIVPDPGSRNPFLPGADRTATSRSYSVTVTSSPPPAVGQPRSPNTIYAGQRNIQLIYRVYLPDRGQDQMGGAGVPDATYTSASGTSLGGQVACSALRNDGAQIPNILPLAAPLYLAQLAEDPFSTTHPAVNPVRWYAVFNDLRLLEPFYAGTWQQFLIGSLPSFRSGLALNFNADSSFLYGYVDRDLGAASAGHNILVLRGKLPTTPATSGGQPTMQSGTQLRYWSLCINDSWASGKVGDCLNDEQIPVDSGRDYTIVVSLPQDRPADATAACGVGWLDWGNLGDGFFRRTAGLLLIRNHSRPPHSRRPRRTSPYPTPRARQSAPTCRAATTRPLPSSTLRAATRPPRRRGRAARRGPTRARHRPRALR